MTRAGLALGAALALAGCAGDGLPDVARTERRIDALIANPPVLSATRRLPSGWRIGRCLLEVDGTRRIDGPCAYKRDKDGGFAIEGPRQVYDGIDYPSAHFSPVLMISTDWWAEVLRDDDGSWTGYGNEDIGAVNGSGSRWGPLRHEGDCFTNAPPAEENQTVRVCLWTRRG